ncbi:hypothetical protein [Nocardiopsis salina]|uniref:hypothetical protein n=1 Tax=Nocardiopsis salina TaxID=245836 RepID=UPI000349F886|nr:hypothetical protein [Nocardiopsis salina]
MADAGRTAHAPRVVTSVRPATAAVLSPLLAAGFLTVLWFLGGAPAHALDLSGATGSSESGALGVVGDGDGDVGDRPGTDDSPGTGSDRNAEGADQAAVTGADQTAPAQEAPRSQPSEPSPDPIDGDEAGNGVAEGVTSELTAPVTGTLDSVHQRLDDPSDVPDGGDPSDSGLSDAGLPVAEVGEGARRVVEGLEHTTENSSGTGLASAVTGQDLVSPDDLADRSATDPSDDEGGGEHGDSSDRLDTDTRAAQETAPDSTGPPAGSASAPASAYADPSAQGNDSAPDAEPGSGGDDHRSSPWASAPNTSAQAAGAAAPGVAGYLTSSSVAGPDSTAVRAPSDAPHGVPSDPADDPTVSPD